MPDRSASVSEHFDLKSSDNTDFSDVKMLPVWKHRELSIDKLKQFYELLRYEECRVV